MFVLLFFFFFAQFLCACVPVNVLWGVSGIARTVVCFCSPSCPSGRSRSLLLLLLLLPSSASASRTEACKDMHAFYFNVSAEGAEYAWGVRVLMNPVWGKPSEPRPCVWSEHVGAEKQIAPLAPQTLPTQLDLPLFFFCFFFPLQCPSLNFSPTVWVRGSVSPPNALPAAAKFPKKEKMESHRATPRQRRCGQTRPSRLRSLLFVRWSTAPRCKVPLSLSKCSDLPTNRCHAAAPARFWSVLGIKPDAKRYICWIPVWGWCVCACVCVFYLLIKKKRKK